MFHKLFSFCLAGCWLFVACTTFAPAKNSASTSAGRVMQSVQEKFCPRPPENSRAFMQISLSVNEPYELSCELAAGHSMLVTMTRFESAQKAKAAFDSALQNHSKEIFHAYSSASWTQAFGPNPDGTKFMLWQPDVWLIKISSSNDTPYAIAPNPVEVAEFILQNAKSEGMLK
jgi:hypothetical protein